MTEDITQDPEYIKGYESRMQDEKKLHDGTYDTPYYQGFRKAGQEICRQKIAKIEEELAEKGSIELDTTLELVVMIKNLDERLKKLEKYTQE